MRDDIVNDVGRCLNQAPVQANFAARIAASPTGPGVGKKYRRRRNPQLGRQQFDAAGKVSPRLFRIPLGDFALYRLDVIWIGLGDIKPGPIEFQCAIAGILT